MNNITEDRKAWHNLEANLGKEERPNICPECKKGILIPRVSFDPANDDSYHYGECDNPDCRYTTL
jgi:hypothetical protein